LGYAPTELLGRSVFEFVPPEDLPQARVSFERALSEPSATVSLEAASAIRTANGEYCSQAVERSRLTAVKL
jgi:PAS domain S-box-containing protein